MKKDQRPAWRLAAALSLAWLMAMAVGMIIAYRSTKYLPLMLGGLTILLPTIVYLVLMLFGGAGEEPTAAESATGNTPNASELPFGTESATGNTPNASEPDNTPGAHQGQGFIGRVRGVRSVLRAAGQLFCRLGRLLTRLYLRSRIGAIAVLSVLAILGVQVVFWLMFRRATTVYQLNYVLPVVLGVMFVMCIIFEKWCSHVRAEGAFAQQLRNIRSALCAARLVTVIMAAAMVVKLLGFYDLLRAVNVIMAVIVIYETLFIVLALVVRGVRRELIRMPDLAIPVPFTWGRNRELGVLSYLEKNTGITMRSLWSMKLVKKMIPYTVILSALLLWICSGVVQVEAYQRGAVYRFGRLCEETLTPGLHLTLPWPIDRVEVYDTDTVRTLTIGYISSEETDNTWTGTHGSNEYKLLLGGGNELVSINLRLEYRISDLEAYLRSSTTPEKLLEAKAYELVTDRTIVTDLDSLLSTDRTAFADSYRTELCESLSTYNTGLELVSVVLESIHPPIDIASVYQEMVGAEIQADKYILEAEAEAAVKLAEARKSYDTALNAAKADSFTKTAAAEADVAEFMASVAADNKYSDSYRYYKYLRAIGNAYGNAKLVIVGRDIDSSNIYFGNLTVTK